MLNFEFALKNPFSRRNGEIKSHTFNVSNHKVCEIGIYKSNNIIGFNFETRFRTDHPGFLLSLSLVGYEILLEYYDTRHFD